MKAVFVVDGPDGKKTLRVGDAPSPEPGPNDLLVAVRAAGLNRADLQRRQQHFASAGGAYIAGLEAAGEVIGMGCAVTGFAIGDRVMAMVNGGYAEQAIVDHRIAIRVPARCNWVDAAALPTLFLTAHDALVTNGRLRAGENVLIHAASSGVGLAALQLARFFGAGKILGTSGSSAKLARLRDLGLDVGIDHTQSDIAQAAAAATGEAGVHVVLDNVGRGTLAASLQVTALGGRIVSIGRMGGSKDEIDLDRLALRRLHLIGVTFRTRTLEDKIAVGQAFLRDCGAALESGALRPVIDRTYPLDEALAAQERMRANAHLGKIVLET